MMKNMNSITVKIIFESKSLKITQEFQNSLYTQLKVNDEIELDIEGNVIECVVTNTHWNFNFFGDTFEVRVKPISEININNKSSDGE